MLLCDIPCYFWDLYGTPENTLVQPWHYHGIFAKKHGITMVQCLLKKTIVLIQTNSSKNVYIIIYIYILVDLTNQLRDIYMTLLCKIQ